MGLSVYLLCHIKFSLPPATKGVIKEKRKNPHTLQQQNDDVNAQYHYDHSYS